MENGNIGPLEASFTYQIDLVDDDTIIEFPEHESWRTSITTILFNRVTISSNGTIPEGAIDTNSPGEITISGVYPNGETVVYTIQATGYPDKNITVNY